MEAELRSDQKGAGEGSGLEGSVTAWEPAMAWDQQGPASGTGVRLRSRKELGGRAGGQRSPQRSTGRSDSLPGIRERVCERGLSPRGPVSVGVLTAGLALLS